MKVTKNGTVPNDLIVDEISKKYGVSTDSIHTHFNARNEFVQYKFNVEEGGKFQTISENTLEDKEIHQIIREILHKDHISFHSLHPEFVHVDGDSREPMDYGSFNFVGYKFTYGSTGN